MDILDKVNSKVFLIGYVFEDTFEYNKDKLLKILGITEKDIVCPNKFSCDVVETNARYIICRSHSDCFSPKDIIRYSKYIEGAYFVLWGACNLQEQWSNLKTDIIESWKHHQLPILQEGKEWTLVDHTKKFDDLIQDHKNTWNKWMYMFCDVLADSYTLDMYDEMRESYGADVRAKCRFCKSNPPKSRDSYTTTHGTCSKCWSYVCGRHLCNSKYNPCYVCPNCWKDSDYDEWSDSDN